jgi:hypothetical protein
MALASTINNAAGTMELRSGSISVTAVREK